MRQETANDCDVNTKNKHERVRLKMIEKKKDQYLRLKSLLWKKGSRMC